MHNTVHGITLSFGIFGSVALFLALALLSPPAAASPLDLPPRPTVPPPVEPTRVPALRGGWIRIQVKNPDALTEIVQWQDGIGAWHDVESWRGQFDQTENGVSSKTWWVGEPLFGAGPFRWAVYGATGQVLGESRPFTMPRENKQTVTVTIGR